MKQAILITAYKNTDHLQKIIDHFDGDYSFFIHIDKKSRISDEQIDSLKMRRGVIISRAYTTNWAGTSHLKAILLLLEMAIRDETVEYIHLVSGHDFPVKSSEFFSTFLEKNKGKQYLEFFELPSEKWQNGGMERLDYYRFYDLINAKGKFGGWINKIMWFQKKIRVKRKWRFDSMKLYGGSTWWTLSYDCCKSIIEYSKKNPAFLKRFNYTYCAEEIFFQTLVLNSPFAANTVNENLRFIVWENRNGNIPAVLDESDYGALMETNALFARRFDYPASSQLMKKIKTVSN